MTFIMVPSTRLLVWLVALSSLLSLGCQSLHFRHASVVRTVADPLGGTRVHVTFEVWDGEQQLTGLSREAFTVFEDGQPATSESLSAAGSDEIKPPVVLLLDTSYSMYLANAVPDLKRAASKFARVLGDNGFSVETFRFANQIERVSSIEDIPEQFDEKTGERFTSLYAAVNKGFGFKQDAIVVVFSDGADNYSKSHGVTSLGAIEAFVLPAELGGSGAQRIVHCIAFGDVQNERDKDGVPGLDALRRISRNGSLSSAADKNALDKVFNDVAQRIRNVYVFEFLSPSTSGDHLLEIEVRAVNQTARSAPMTFTAGGSTAPQALVEDEGAPIGARMLSLEQQCAEGVRQACMAFSELVPQLKELETRLEMLGAQCQKGDQEACEQFGKARLEFFGEAGLAKMQKHMQDQVNAVADRCAQGDDAVCGELREAFLAGKVGGRGAVAIIKKVAAAKPAWIDAFEKDCEANDVANACVVYWVVRKPAGLGVQFDESLAVSLVQPGGGASQAGMQVGDLLVSVDGKPLAGMSRLQQMNALRGTPGSQVRITVSRAGKNIDLAITRAEIE